MPRKFYYLLPVLLILFNLSACLKKTKAERLDVQCNQLITEALTLHKTRKKALEKITNLIEAAKIDQQHSMYAACADKASRAISLLGKKAGEKKSDKP